jgi:RNA polymerase sigma factor (sigma-70 family)
MSHQRADDRWLIVEPESTPTAIPPRRRSLRNIAVPPLRNPLAPTVSVPVLLPIIGANDELLPALEERLKPIAIRAKEGDRIARNALYAAFEPKIVRMSRRMSVPQASDTMVGVWDRDDVLQEAFIAFAELIETWQVSIPFGRYILANLPWRLRDAVYRGIGKRTVPPRTRAVPISYADLLPDSSLAPEQRLRLIAIVAEQLPDPLGQILYEHMGKGRSQSAIADDLGISRRTISRYWLQIRQHLGEGWTLEDEFRDESLAVRR